MIEEFLDILTRYQGIIHKVNLVYFRDKTDREDNFQEIVFNLWKSFPRLKNKESIGSWIYAVAINTSISGFKKGIHRHVEYYDNVPDVMINDDQAETLEQNARILLEAIHSLNEIDKSVMLLYLEEKSYSEIASILGMTVSNVGVRINRSKELLKHKIYQLENGK
jgi:RNA polymerase sigma-70 factor (ECF subfamily)